MAARRATLPRGLPALWAAYRTGEVPHEQLDEAFARSGARAAPFLTQALEGPEAWRAAMLLARLGPAAAKATGALRALVRDGPTEPSRAWPARALAALGRFDLLLPLLDSARPTDHFSLAEALKFARPGSYPLLEQCLTKGPASFARCVRHTLAPGCAAFDFAPAALPQLLAAARSTHPVLRRDAVCNLPNTTGTAKARVAPALAAALADRDGEVRRLAVLGLSALGLRALRPVEPTLRALTKDPAKGVGPTAAHALARLR